MRSRSRPTFSAPISSKRGGAASGRADSPNASPSPIATRPTAISPPSCAAAPRPSIASAFRIGPLARRGREDKIEGDGVGGRCRLRKRRAQIVAGQQGKPLPSITARGGEKNAAMKTDDAPHIELFAG